MSDVGNESVSDVGDINDAADGQGQGTRDDALRVWVNGERVEPGAPTIAALDHGLTVGDGVFETCKVRDGAPFALRRHLARLDRSMAGLGLPRADHDLIEAGIKSVLAGEPIKFGRLRCTVTAGIGPLGSDRNGSPLTYIVAAGPQPRNPQGGKLVVVPWMRNEHGAVAGLKTTSYAENVVALAFAAKRGGVEAVFANTAGNLCEGTGSNVFVILNGQILTPDLASGPLAGVTRALVIQWCRQEGLTVRIEPLPISVLERADEVFITSSTKDVLPIHGVDERPIPAPGPLTARAGEIFARLSAEHLDP